MAEYVTIPSWYGDRWRQPIYNIYFIYAVYETAISSYPSRTRGRIREFADRRFITVWPTRRSFEISRWRGYRVNATSVTLKRDTSRHVFDDIIGIDKVTCSEKCMNLFVPFANRKESKKHIVNVEKGLCKLFHRPVLDPTRKNAKTPQTHDLYVFKLQFHLSPPSPQCTSIDLAKTKNRKKTFTFVCKLTC